MTTLRNTEESEAARAHNTALVFPEAEERPIIHLIQAWESYATEYSRTHEGELIGAATDLERERIAWKRIGRALLDLSLQDIGRLQGKVLRRSIHAVLQRNGVER